MRAVALLRGINVGGKNMLPMRDLVRVFADLDCADVRTYIQSGNVVFESSHDVLPDLPARLSERIKDGFGLFVPVVVRTVSELAAVPPGNPFLAEGADTSVLHVGFLSAEPTAERLAALDPRRSPPDEFAVVGRQVYLRCPGGLARTKLTNDYFDRTLGVVTTVRNWRTVMTLLDMASA